MSRLDPEACQRLVLQQQMQAESRIRSDTNINRTQGPPEIETDTKLGWGVGEGRRVKPNLNQKI